MVIAVFEEINNMSFKKLVSLSLLTFTLFTPGAFSAGITLKSMHNVFAQAIEEVCGKKLEHVADLNRNVYELCDNKDTKVEMLIAAVWGYCIANDDTGISSFYPSKEDATK